MSTNTSQTITRVKNKLGELLQEVESLKQVNINNLDEMINKVEGDNRPYLTLNQALTEIRQESQTQLTEINSLEGIIRSNTNDIRKEANENRDMYLREKSKLNNLKQNIGASQELKVDMYDVKLLDNMYIIYYLLSFGIIGIFIYKTMKK